jgi:hypothetical protein
MVNSKKKIQKKPTKKAPKKSSKSIRPASKSVGAKVSGLARGDSSAAKLPVQTHAASDSASHQGQRSPSIEIRSIDGETTIGDLIVAFPRTRDVLMKHGLRFDVEEAGYLYMTLSVFSAIHGHSTSSLVEQLVVVSKEPPPPPAVIPLRPIPVVPTS